MKLIEKEAQKLSSESWNIQNQRHIQKPDISKTVPHSEPEAYSDSRRSMDTQNQKRPNKDIQKISKIAN